MALDESLSLPTDEPAVTPADPVEQAPESRRASLARALTEVANPEGEQKVSDRARDEAGRFAAAAKAAAAAPAKGTLTAKGVAPEAIEPPKWKRPPQSWAKELHEAWEKGDLNKIREHVHTREDQMRAGVEGAIFKAKFADQVNQALEPHIATIKALNIEPAVAIKGLLDTDQKLRTLPPAEKVQFAAGLLQQYGVDLKAMFGIAQNSGGQTERLWTEVQALKQENAALNKITQEVEDQRLTAQIESFKSKPHFNELQTKMAKYLDRGLADTLEEAYELALSTSPSLAAQAPQVNEAQRRAAADKAAKTARAAAVSVRGATPGTNTTTSKAQDRRSMLAEQLSSVDGRL